MDYICCLKQGEVIECNVHIFPTFGQICEPVTKFTVTQSQGLVDVLVNEGGE